MGMEDDIYLAIRQEEGWAAAALTNRDGNVGEQSAQTDREQVFHDLIPAMIHWLQGGSAY